MLQRIRIIVMMFAIVEFNSLPIHQPAFAPFILRISFLQVVVRILYIAASAGGEDIDGFAAQVVRFDEGVDDSWCGVPPNRESNPHHIVFGDVVAMSFDCRT